MTTQAAKCLAETFSNIVCFNDIVGEMVDAVAENLTPEEVFDKTRLEEWAEENGYVKAE